MITKNGKTIEKFPIASKEQLKNAEAWAKKACNKIFSHYTKQELSDIRKRNQ